MNTIGFDKEYLEIVQELPNSVEEYQYWLGLKERKLYFNADIDMTIINKINYWILRWNEEDDQNGVGMEKRKPIEIYISSNGGCVVSGFSTIDIIQSSKTPIHTIGVAVCASMGSLLLLAGHKRKCYKNTIILIHDGNLALSNSTKKAKQQMQFYDKLDDRIKDFVLNNSNIAKELYEEKEDDEWYIFGDEAVKLGIIDEVI